MQHAYMQTNVGRVTGQVKAISSDRLNAFNLYRQIEGANKSGNYWNHNRCMNHTIQQTDMTGQPIWPRANVMCENLYPQQAGLWRQYMQQASVFNDFDPPQELVIPDRGPIAQGNFIKRRRPACLRKKEGNVSNMLMTYRMMNGHNLSTNPMQQ